jgi:TolB-like protein
MVEDRVQRRLAAILAADVVGYSRLMESDETRTLATLKARRKNVLEPLVAKHKGRIFKVTGDGVLIEFTSAVRSVQCAVELQQEMAAANGNQPEDRHIMLRIGVNLGDVMVEGGDLYGDGVNIAARLESIAQPGGILISAAAFDHVRNKIDLQFDDLGTQILKNIAEPMRIFRVAGMSHQSTSTPKLAADKPAIAVLPFTNMSGDPDQEYFSDGITEDIITELSRFHGVSVTARNSSFQYHNKAVDVRQVGRELGVQYVVEGSIRMKSGNVRVTVQLVDASTGNHLWAERYDRTFDDIFQMQDEVVHKIAARLEGRLATNIAELARRKPTNSMTAYDCVLQARQHLGTFDWAAAEPLARRAVALDPNYAQAHAWLSKSIVYRFFFELRVDLLKEALPLAQRAVTLDDGDGVCHVALAQCYLWQRQFERAGVHYDRAVALNPTDALTLAHRCRWLTSMGRHQEALEGLDEVLLLEPFPPSWYWEARSLALFAAKRYQETIDAIGRMSRLHYYNHAGLAACYAELGNTEAARAEAAETMRLKPDMSIERYMLTDPFKNAADTAAEIASLRKAGLPE